MLALEIFKTLNLLFTRVLCRIRRPEDEAIHWAGIGKHQSQKASNIGGSFDCGNCNPFLVLKYLQGTLKKKTENPCKE
jgi:hypothetical protein